MKFHFLHIVLLVSLCSISSVQATYEEEVKGFGGAKIPDIVNSAEKIEVYKIKPNASYAANGKYETLTEPMILNGEEKHMILASMSSAAARRGKLKSNCSPQPEIKLIFTRDKQTVDILISEECRVIDVYGEDKRVTRINCEKELESIKIWLGRLSNKNAERKP